MNDQPVENPLDNRPPNEDWEMHLQATARAFPYPPTPDLAAAVRRRAAGGSRRLTVRRGLLWAAIILLVSLCALLAVPQVRAAVLEFLRIGAVHFFESGSASPTSSSQPTALRSILDLAGETTLVNAQSRVKFPIRLPTYPADLGRPDHVFLQDLGGDAVVLVWMDARQPGTVRLALSQLTNDVYIRKSGARLVTTTTVGGQPAVWTEGPYMLEYIINGRANPDVRQVVTGHALIWAESTITYRLETDLPLDEAIRVAESLH